MPSRHEISASQLSFASRITRGPRGQRGFAVLMVVFVLMLGAASVGLTFSRPTSGNELPDETTAEAFGAVKSALVGYAVRQGVFQCQTPDNATQCIAELNASTKLGELPCPDTDNDGFAEAACSTRTLGRVPWKTLGIPEPRDNAGETLWYAVSIRFLGNASNPIIKDGAGRVSSGAINSNTPGNLTVRGPDGSAQTTAAVAVIFSPGASLGQNRSTALMTCAGVANVQRSNCAANYLETSGATNNATIGGPFINGPSAAGFNDRLLFISAADIMPLLEMRLGNELRALLVAYKDGSDCFCYPWADSWNYSGGIADIGMNRGRFPSSQVYPEDWGTGKIPPFPTWLKDNDWHNQVFYAASNRETDPNRTCLFCSGNLDLTVKLTPAVNSPVVAAGAVILTPGTPRPGVVRPYLPSQAISLTNTLTAAMNLFASYFEDADNNNLGSCPGNLAEHASNPTGISVQVASAACDTVVQPQSRSYDRDRLFYEPREIPAKFCGPAGQALLRNAPCHTTGHDVTATCASLATKLTQCSATCSTAAQDMLEVPCRNTLNSANCVQPIAALNQCTP